MPENRYPNYYKILGVNPKATKKEIRQAFTRLSMKYQREMKTGSVPGQKFYEVYDAYQFLIDDKNRKRYDQYLKWQKEMEEAESAAEGEAPEDKEELYLDLDLTDGGIETPTDSKDQEPISRATKNFEQDLKDLGIEPKYHNPTGETNEFIWTEMQKEKKKSEPSSDSYKDIFDRFESHEFKKFKSDEINDLENSKKEPSPIKRDKNMQRIAKEFFETKEEFKADFKNSIEYLINILNWSIKAMKDLKNGELEKGRDNFIRVLKIYNKFLRDEDTESIRRELNADDEKRIKQADILCLNGWKQFQDKNIAKAIGFLYRSSLLAKDALTNLKRHKKLKEESSGRIDLKSLAKLRFKRALEAINNKDYAHALTGIQVAIQYDPKNPLYQSYLAYVLAKTGRNLRKAVVAGAQAIEAEAGNPLHHYHLGIVYKAAKIYPRAKDEFLEALKLDPRFIKAKKELEDLPHL